MERPVPTTRDVALLAGASQRRPKSGIDGDVPLAGLIFRGMNEVPLNNIYDRLNLDEAAAFWVASWTLREQAFHDNDRNLIKQYLDHVERKGLYELFASFNRIPVSDAGYNEGMNARGYTPRQYKSAFAWFNAARDPGIRSHGSKFSCIVNPFNALPFSPKLEKRLEGVSQSVIDDLKEKLSEDVREYHFESQERQQTRNMRQKEVLHTGSFDQKYPDENRLFAQYAKGIADKFKRYPTNIVSPTPTSLF